MISRLGYPWCGGGVLESSQIICVMLDNKTEHSAAVLGWAAAITRIETRKL